MHYIVGTKIQSHPTGNTRKLMHEFTSGCEYSLTRIYRDNENNKIIYVFNTYDGAADKPQVIKQFDSTRQGDAFISKILSESIPDYDAIYAENDEDAATKRQRLLEQQNDGAHGVRTYSNGGY